MILGVRTLGNGNGNGLGLGKGFESCIKENNY
jgi:hypothetical protein